MADDEVFVPAFHKPSSLLPIAPHRESLLFMIENTPVVIVVASTGSGKTTQIPQFLDQAGWCGEGKMIAVTQPRRVAATSVAARVAEEMRCKVGEQVGYSIRFEDQTSAITRIKFMTDGMLLREALVDPLLTRYSVIMIDEAHERSISSDILLGILKKIIKRRPDLRVVVSSATIQAEDFLQFFGRDDVHRGADSDQKDHSGCKAITLDGKAYPVDILFMESPVQDYLEKAVDTVFDIHNSEADGDILVLLTGREEISSALQMVSDRTNSLPLERNPLMALPMYGGLTTEQQLYVFEPAPEGTRKVIFSTNIAEASVTIDGIVYVVDCGFVKLRTFNPITGIEALTAAPISQASAIQRAGRAGRTRPGKCFRLYTEEGYQSMRQATVPEIQRSNLASVILQLKALGIDNIARFDFITPPPAELVTRALEFLYSLGALDDYAKLTRPTGLRMAEMSLSPMMAKILLESAAGFACVSEILSICAMASLQGSLWLQQSEKRVEESARRKFAAEEGDHLTLLNVYRAFTMQGRNKDAKWCRENQLSFKSLSQAVSIRAQLRNSLRRYGIEAEENSEGPRAGLASSEQIRRCLTTGLFANAARMQPDGSFKTVNGSLTLHAHPSSLMFNRKADWVIFQEVVQTTDKTFIRDVTGIERSWLTEYAPNFYSIR